MIRVTELAFAYKGADHPILSGLNFAVEPGTVYGLLGPSGAGKSTTQKILMGLLSGFSGVAEVFGKPPAADGRAFYQRIGVSFELPALYLRLTALENLRLFAALYTSAPVDPMTALESVDLVEAANSRVETFSKGMKMRLNLCRALLNDPELLFLDEPTTGQDPARARLTRDLVRRLKDRGKTVFLTTHNMTEAAEICDRVGFLVGGRIAVEGAPADLMRRYGNRQLQVTVAGDSGLESRTFPMEGLGANAVFQALLDTDAMVSMHTLEASLDDVFIAATNGDVR